MSYVIQPECEIHQFQEYGMCFGLKYQKIWIEIGNVEFQKVMSGLKFGMWNFKEL